jgi:hypothetical protein
MLIDPAFISPSDSTPARSPVSSPAEPPRFLSEETYQTLFNQLRAAAKWPNSTLLFLSSAWRSDVRWARNRTTLADDWRNTNVDVRCGGDAATNQIAPEALRAVVGWLDTTLQQFRGGLGADAKNPTEYIERKLFPATYIWSDATYAQTQDTRLAIANHLISGADTAGMLSAGYLGIQAQGNVLELRDHHLLFAPQTIAQCSLTVRDPSGRGSGWAGRSSFDWSRVDAEKLAATALDKCLKSRNPVRIEPGRYTTILEPQAVFDLVEQLWRNRFLVPYWDLAKNSSDPNLPFHGEQTKKVSVSQYGDAVQIKTTKLGDRVVDPRINISFDPLDPDLGCVPFTSGGYPIQPVQWITKGVLTMLSFPPALSWIYQMQFGHPLDPHGQPDTGSFRIDGGTATTTIDEMIASTTRGLLVTRFWGVQLIDIPSVLCTGATRDGLWLIEHGKISHPVTNLRFTESPLFALNQVDQIGTPVPIFSPAWPAVVPPIKVQDFSFTSLEDAV